MVRQVAYRMARRFPQCVDADDLVNIGMIGLIDAVDRYQADRAPSFAAYARIRVQGAIVDEMRKNDWVPRSVRDRSAMIERARAELKTKHNRDPSSSEIAAHLGVEERLLELIQNANIRVLVSTEEGGDDNLSVGERLQSPDADPEEQLLDTTSAPSSATSSVTFPSVSRSSPRCTTSTIGPSKRSPRPSV